MIDRREELAATLQAKLETLRSDSSLLKKKAILADATLDELQQVSRAKSCTSSSLHSLT
jgi:hypothetical protein